MEYASVVRGFNTDPTGYYQGTAGSLAGTPAGFQAAALFLMNDVVAPVQQTLWGNQDAVAGSGWSLAVRQSAVVGVPPNAIDVIARVGGVTKVATLLSAYPGVPILAHMAAGPSQDPANIVPSLYINGVLAALSDEVGAIVASTGSPIVGALSNGVGIIEPCLQAQILGVMYHEGATPVGVSPASFYVACREAETLVPGLDNSVLAAWQNQYTVQRGLTGRGIIPTGNNGPLPPTIWSPDVGLVPLTRVGTALTVRGYKNLDWHTSLFATLAVP